MTVLTVLALLLGCAWLVFGCASIPRGLQPVTDWDVTDYAGTWHEVARLDHWFERGLSQVTATYTLRPDGAVTVLNRGYDDKAGAWREAKGVARLRGAANEGRLKVSFFAPFYGAYNILAWRKGGPYAVVCGNTHDYFWILSRTPELPAAELAALLERAAGWGFATNRLIFPAQMGDLK